MFLTFSFFTTSSSLPHLHLSPHFPTSSLDCNSTPDSGPNSPPSSTTLGVGVVGSRGSPTSAPIQEENEEGSQYQPGQRSSIQDLPLFSSPSLPNISLGRPHLTNAQAAGLANYAMFAAQHVAAAAAAGAPPMPVGVGVGVAGTPPTYYSPLALPFGRQAVPPLGMMPATGIAPQPSPVVRSASATSTSSSQASLVGDVAPPQAHAASTILPSSSSYMQLSGVPGGVVPSGASAVNLHAAVVAAAVAGSLPPTNSHAHALYAGHQQQHSAHNPHAVAAGSHAGHALPITDAQVAQVHLHKQGHRPLGRTQSAPLPLGHPMLTGAGQLNVAQTHYENSEVSKRGNLNHIVFLNLT